MNQEVKEEIDKLLELNDFILDLSNLAVDLDEPGLDYILDKIKQVPNVGKIIWNSNLDQNQFNSKFDIIEAQLIENNENYTSFPSDHIHCLMSYHVYTDTSTKNRQANLDVKREKAWSKLNEHGWAILEVFEEKEYKSILYVNQKKKQLVLSFQGIRLKLSDFFTAETKQIDPFVYLLLQNKDILHQTIYSYLHTKRAIDLCEESRYILSFTGYSFGAWLAEQCVFFCHKDFNKRDVRAVTFESPGSYDFLDKLKISSLVNDELKFDLEDLDIRTYLNEPNFINTCNRHLGKIFRVYSANTQSITNQFIYDQIELIEEESIRKSLMRNFENKIKPSSEKNTFFLKGIKSLLPDGLELMLSSFDVDLKVKKIVNWPRTEFKSSKEFRETFKNLVDADQVLRLIPFIQSVPESIKAISSSFTNLTLKQNCEIVNDHLNSLSIVFTLVTETVSGAFNDEKFLEYFQQNDNLVSELPRETRNLFNKKNFVVNFDSHYKVQEANVYRELLNNHLYGSVDYYLEKFAKINEFSNLNDDFMIKQLEKLRSEFQIETDDKQIWIKSQRVPVEVIRERFERLILLDDRLRSFFEVYFCDEQKVIEHPGKLRSYFKESKLKCFVCRERELRYIREKFHTKQYVCIYGKAGCGKSALARQYAYERAEKDKFLLVRWIDASCEQNILIDFKRIAHELNINNKDQGIISLVKNKLNNQSKNDKYLFILDNVTNEEDLSEVTYGFSKNCDFILTTRNELIEINDDFNYEKLFLKNLNRDEALLLIRKTLRVKMTDQITESEWKEILDLIESSKNVTISPLKLNKLIAVINEHPSWSLGEIKSHIQKEKENKFYLMKSECSKAYAILNYLAYLDGSSISLELIRSIFLDDNTNEIVNALNYLVRYSLLTPNDTGFKLHELTQAEVVTSAKYSDSISRSHILNRIVLALNNLFINKNIDDAKSSMSKKTELLAKQIYKIVTIEWDSKFKNENCANLFKKMAKLSKEIIYDYKASLNFYLDELKCKKEIYSPNHSTIASSLSNIAVSYYCLDDYKKSLEFYNEAYKIYKESSSYNAVNIANCQHNLAVVYRHLEQYKLALDTYEESLRLKRENLPAKHTSIAMTLNNLALVYENVEMFDKALASYTECLEIFRDTLPSNHTSIASVLTSIANVHRKMGEYELALESQLEALEIKKQEHPESTAALAMTYNNLGLIYCYLENFEKSLEMYNECLRLFIDTLPANYSSIASTINNIANVYSDAGEYKKALENYKEALRIKRETLPSNHSSIATTLNNIGLIYEHLGDLEKAIENYKECLIIFIETLPPTHTSIVSTLMSIGNVHFKLGEYNRALENYIECLSIRKQAMPNENISIGTTLNSIGFVYDKLGEHDKALNYFTESFKIYEKILPANHPTLSNALKNIENIKRKIS